MSVFRIEKNKNYTVMSNYHLRDKNLSYKAKGLLSFMLSLRDDWDYSIQGLVSVSKESTKAIRSTLEELEDNNYLIREKIQLKNGRFDYNYHIYETPHTQKGNADNGDTKNDTQINTNLINIKEQDKLDKTINIITKELIKRKFIEITDLDIYRYDDLFNELLQVYEFKEIIIATSYFLKFWKLNKGLDEDGYEINDKFNYFKESLKSNLRNITTEIDLG